MDYLDQSGNYIQGEPISGAIEVFPKPSPFYVLKADWRSAVPDVWELDISLHKEAKAKEIDKKTETLISQGFEFGGKQFSLSDNAQRKLLILQNLIAMDVLDPVTPMSALDESAYNLARGDAQAFVAAGYSRLSGLIQSGTTLKGQVMAAETVEAISAIQDTRE